MWTVPDNVKEWHTEYDKQYTHTEILEATIEDDEPVAPPPHHPPHHPHHPPPHHPHHHHSMGLAMEDEDDEGVDYKESEEEFIEEDPLISSMCCREGYGELTRSAVEKMADTVGLTTDAPAGHFFDLGSGAGKIVMHMALAGYATAATGVEISANRHAAAVHLAQEYLYDDADVVVTVGKTLDRPTEKEVEASSSNGPHRHLRLLEGDMLDADLSEATVVYMNHACFPKDIVDALVEKLLSVDGAPKLQVVLTTPRLPALVESGHFAAGSGYLNLPMEMYDGYGTLLTVYRRVTTQTGVDQLSASA